MEIRKDKRSMIDIWSPVGWMEIKFPLLLGDFDVKLSNIRRSPDVGRAG